MNTEDKYKALVELRVCDFTPYEIWVLNEAHGIGVGKWPEGMFRIIDYLYDKMYG